MRANPRALAAIIALATFDAGAAAADDLAALRARGRLRVIYGSYGMPEAISFKHHNAPGLERELIEAFAALHALEVEYVPVETSEERIPALLAGKGDLVLGGLGVTEARRKLVDFSTEIFPTRHVVVTRRPDSRIESLEELRRTRVGTTKGSSWAESVMATGISPQNVDGSYATPEEMLAALRERRVSAVVMAVGWTLLEQRKDPQIQLGMFLGGSVGRAWAVQKNSPQLLQALDDFIGNVRRSGSWNRLVVKYYGELALPILQRSRLSS